ncbi:hypothetical protein [Rhizobium rhizogenes]|uniref:hypothetical protein n=1 Tax=Rhizobium rhizogenes TaxID=359 RepID=UPI00226F9CF0|nr:hypothetical protein [Rhizobium rhizogenes]
MPSVMKMLLRLLDDSSISKIEVTAMPPFVKISFEKNEIEALLSSRALVSDALARLFIRRRVYWWDLSKENPTWVVESLVAAETELDGLAKELSSKLDPEIRGLAKFIRSWATASHLVSKTLIDQLKDIDDEKASVLGYDSAGEDRQEALNETLIDLRRRIYPTIQMLVAFLDDDDPTKIEAQTCIDKGLNTVANVTLLRDVTPDIDGI